MSIELTILMPCLNERETLATCIRKAHTGAKEANVDGYEILIADNGSTDGSQEIAVEEGARVVTIDKRGYGAALRGGFGVATGKYVIMGDSDDSYDWTLIKPFIEKLREGYDVVMGSRLRGKILPGAMPWMHRWVGNPILTGIANLVFNTQLSDYHCGLRGFHRERISQLGLKTHGMEFATEFIARAAMQDFSFAEVPITYYPDGRSTQPHLRMWRDGWRHLSFILILSPRWVLLYPGIFFFVLGIVTTLSLLPGELNIGTVNFDVHTLLVASTASIIGLQLMTFWLIAQFYIARLNIRPLTPFLKRIKEGVPLSLGLIMGLLLIGLGFLPVLQSLNLWSNVSFGDLNYQITLRWLIPGLTLSAMGLQIFFGSFIMSLINLMD